MLVFIGQFLEDMNDDKVLSVLTHDRDILWDKNCFASRLWETIFSLCSNYEKLKI